MHGHIKNDVYSFPRFLLYVPCLSKIVWRRLLTVSSATYPIEFAVTPSCPRRSVNYGSPDSESPDHCESPSLVLTKILEPQLTYLFVSNGPN